MGKLFPRKSEGAGKAGCLMHPQPRVRMIKKAHEPVTTGSPQHSGFPCTMVYGLFRALPGDRACLPPSLAGCPANLTPASGRQDHTALPSASLCRRRSTPLASIASRANVRDDHDTPLCESAGRRAYRIDLGQARSGIFLQGGLDSFSLICPSGSHALRRHPPRKRGIQYAAAFRFDHGRHGILGRPLSRAMTAGVCGWLGRPRAQRVCSSVVRAADLCEGRFPESPSSHGSGFHDPSAAGWYAVHAEAAGFSSAFGAAECFASAGDASRASAAIEPAKIVFAIRI